MVFSVKRQFAKKSCIKHAVRFLIAVFIFTMFSGINVKAAGSATYYNGQYVKVGLESMKNNNITVTLNGDYYINNVRYKDGTSLTLLKNNDKINLNGITVDSVNFVPSQTGNTISIGKNKYLGIVSFQIKNSAILPINSIYIEDYLKGVVPSEMYSTYNIEALKAQAIAARSYALRKLTNGYDLDDTTNCQAYKGYYGTLTNVNKAVDETRGMVLQYQSNLIEALYSASNGGYIEDSSNVWSGSFPYYKEKQDPFDPQDSWTRQFTTADIDKILKSKKLISSTDTFTGINTNTITKYQSGRVSNIEINYVNSAGTPQMAAYSKESARMFLSLPSSLYTVTFDGKTYTFTGKGIGHGIGMSQIGAQQMALSGKTYSDILNFYYPGTNVANVAGDIITPPTPPTPPEPPEPPATPPTPPVTPPEPPVTPPTPTTLNGWVSKDGSWYLYADNNYLTGWQKVNNKWYYLDSTGIMKTGWLKDGTTWYFMDNSGAMDTGWIKDGTTWYFLNDSGAMATGWIKSGGKWYFLKSSGAMATGWIQLGSKWYYLYSDGSMACGTTIGTYKLDASGAWIK
ncbi:SpoIID/LytB domain-containing protein [Clostridium sp. JN-9]|uniref:SpoIID/LytB domain-containing protein n=1 Tax=Clostridium sp. JN-9 TaxID=2507159 RepID=UPI000FFE06F8|nr:SpoIID/LytB domain-containing protein [Clostridium sp. JN-9]QAT40912.1 SpoIID/LytB domain-containing protein [Clostridium sp. JN-9]